MRAELVIRVILVEPDVFFEAPERSAPVSAVDADSIVLEVEHLVAPQARLEVRLKHDITDLRLSLLVPVINCWSYGPELVDDIAFFHILLDWLPPLCRPF